MSNFDITYIVGRRHAGKSSMITDLLQKSETNPAKILIVYEADHDKAHHETHSPGVTLRARHELKDAELLNRPGQDFDVIVLDNVVSNSADWMLKELLVTPPASKVYIVAVTHPNMIPIDVQLVHLCKNVQVLQLSDYEDASGSQRLNTLKATYAFQLAANVPGSGNTSIGTGPLWSTARHFASMSQSYPRCVHHRFHQSGTSKRNPSDLDRIASST